MTAAPVGPGAQDAPIASFEREPSAPRVALPRGSTDCHLHVFGDPAVYPPRNAHNMYAPPPAGPQQMHRMRKTLGIERVVLVQGALYTTDNALMLETLKACPPGTARGVALIDDAISDAQLLAFHEAGVRGIRFSFWPRMGVVPSLDLFDRSVARVRHLGWHVKVFMPPAVLCELADRLARLEVTVVLDHLANLDCTLGPAQPGYREALALMRRPNFWTTLSNGDRWSATGYPWKDAEPLGRAFYDVAPERCVWGSDWPHLKYGKPGTPREADLLDLLTRSLPDEQALQRVLVDNPARLYGFT